MQPHKLNAERLPERMQRLFERKKSLFWERERENRALALFHQTAAHVPAYKDFLKKNRIRPEKIKTFADFQAVPPINKQNYLRRYPPEKLIWGGKYAEGSYVWTATSGSTGTPYFFLRNEELDARYSVIIEEFFRNAGFGSGSTLVILGFAMGIWSAGIMTYRAFEIAGKRLGRHVSIITPGVNKPVIFSAFEKLSPHFDHTVFVGYPPFVKDVVNEAVLSGIPIKNLGLKIYFAGETFAEPFRKYIASETGIKNRYRDIFNVYGSADLGAIAFETPSCAYIREQALRRKDIFHALFPNIEKAPTLLQYNASYICFESVDSEILVTGDNALPLVRYSISDHGGVFSAKDIIERLGSFNIGKHTLEKATKAKFRELPFVYVYERSDFSTKLYGAIVYAENIREGLGHPSLANHVTGKFTMTTR